PPYPACTQLWSATRGPRTGPYRVVEPAFGCATHLPCLLRGIHCFRHRPIYVVLTQRNRRAQSSPAVGMGTEPHPGGVVPDTPPRADQWRYGIHWWAFGTTPGRTRRQSHRVDS